MSLILGIDEAGRGPLIGPMVIAGVLLTKKQEIELKKENIKDSKLLSHRERIRLAKIIKDNSLSYKILTIFPEEIDEAVISRFNLNNMEAKKAAEIINVLNETKKQIKVVIDCPSTNVLQWKNKVLSFIKHKPNLSVLCEHKADLNHMHVGAASILAKVTREDEMDKIRKQFEAYGDIGSGYPADPITKNFLKKNEKVLRNSNIVRRSWQTWKEIFPDKEQRTLEQF